MSVWATEIAHPSPLLSDLTEQFIKEIGRKHTLESKQGHHASVLLEQPLRGSAPTPGEEEDSGGEGSHTPGLLATSWGRNSSGLVSTLSLSCLLFKTSSCIYKWGVNWEFPWELGNFQIAQGFLLSCAQDPICLMLSGFQKSQVS